MNRLDLLAVQGTLKGLFQHHSSKASILRHSAFFTVQLSHPYMTTGKTIALTRQTFVGKVISVLFNMLSRLVITFLYKAWAAANDSCPQAMSWAGVAETNSTHNQLSRSQLPQVNSPYSLEGGGGTPTTTGQDAQHP